MNLFPFSGVLKYPIPALQRACYMFYCGKRRILANVYCGKRMK